MTIRNHHKEVAGPCAGLFFLILFLFFPITSHAQSLIQYVDPRIGSEGEGRTFIGPTAPFGMVKPGPDCMSMPNAGWAPMPDAVKGFTQTHVSGTGGGQKYGNVLIQGLYLPLSKGEGTSLSLALSKGEGMSNNDIPNIPNYTKLLLPDGRIVDIPVFPSKRQKEEISLGYYSCTYDNGIKTEITTAPRCAFYRLFGADALYIDAASFLGMDTIPNKRETQQYVGSAISQTAPNEVCGYTCVRGGWNNGDPYKVFFCIESNRKLIKAVARDSLYCLFCLDSLYSPESLHSPVSPLSLQSPISPSPTTLKVGISYVSIEQARKNISPLSFDAQLDTLRHEWEQMLARMPYTAQRKDLKTKRMFYTALYHTLIMPVDKTGEYPRRKLKEKNSKKGINGIASPLPFGEGWGEAPYFDDYYTIWDTYRTSFPLLMDYYPDIAVKMVNSLLNIYQHEGYMPDARSGDCNGRTQGGSNAEAVIYEALKRKLKGIDYNLALEAMLKDAEVPPANDEREGRGGLREYNSLGYIPYGIPRAGTRTVEYSYDDWCIAQVAKGLGHKDLYKKYMKRSKNWQNLWRSDYEWQGMRGFIMPKDAQGHWLDSVPWGKSKVFHPTIPYKPDTKVAPWYIPWWDTFFYEALSAEYSLSIPHDIPTLIKLCGGDSAFRKRLDIFFDNGHYNVGNEPSFYTPYLYSHIGRPDLTRKRLTEIIDRYFDDTPTGLPGNDDSGAMSAWLIGSLSLALSEGEGMSNTDSIPSNHNNRHQQINKKNNKNNNKYKNKNKPNQHNGIEGGQHSTSFGGGWGKAFTLNRQYRNWKLSYAEQGDTLLINCHDNIYITPKDVVEHATGFCWESPYKTGNTYYAKGTFLFISKDALKSLLSKGYFIYDSITWRSVDNEGTQSIANGSSLIHVRADIDGTDMWIDSASAIPWVKKMQNNPLGIDWDTK